jgi:predicted glutamine amidotransferase
MCELLGMNANVPTDIRFSFSGLVNRGGRTGPHRDGWGIAFYEARGCRVFHDPMPSATSPLARLVRDLPIKSRVVIAHVRRANRGRVAVENTHPFTRELWGRAWCFAHNGQLRGVKKLPLRTFKPVGTIDSEHAFCWILDRLRARFTSRPSKAQIDAEIAAAFAELRQLGVFTALLSEGSTLYVSCSKNLWSLTRRAPFGQAHLIDEDLEVDFAAETTERDVVTILATRPLTQNETWTALAKGSTQIFRDGEAVRFGAAARK